MTQTTRSRRADFSMQRRTNHFDHRVDQVREMRGVGLLCRIGPNQVKVLDDLHRVALLREHRGKREQRAEHVMDDTGQGNTRILNRDSRCGVPSVFRRCPEPGGR